MKIGRFAVAENHQGEHIGSMLIRAIREMLLRRASVGACRFITVDALVGKRAFYERNGFRLLQNEIPENADTVLMYFDLKAFTGKEQT